MSAQHPIKTKNMATKTNKRGPGRTLGQKVVKATYKVQDLVQAAPDARFEVKVSLTASQMQSLGIQEFSAPHSTVAKALAKALGN